MKKIEIGFSEEDLQRMLHDNEEFNWTFDGIDVRLFKED